MEINIGLLSYWTHNIGDWYQTGSALYLWWCYFNKPGTFKEFIDNIITKSKIDNFNVIWLYRDGMSNTTKPKNCSYCILICNGWFMHQQKGVLDFPPPSWIIPIYTSIHIQHPELLDNDLVVEHFKNFQPIGCRDISTLNLLKNHNIDAYFSGCLSMILNLKDANIGFDITKDFKNKNLYIDVEEHIIDKTHEYYITTQNITEWKNDINKIMESVQNAVNYIHSNKIVTTRLHIWLPLLSNDSNSILINGYTNKEFLNGGKDSGKVNRFTGLTDICYGDKKEFENFKKRLFDESLLRIKNSFTYMDEKVEKIISEKYYLIPWKKNEYPFQYVMDKNGKVCDDILIILAPIIESKAHIFWDAKKAGKLCIGIMSCWTWPYYNEVAAKIHRDLCSKINLPYLQDIINSMDGWLRCERNSILHKSILYSESDNNDVLKDNKLFNDRTNDIVYCGGVDDMNYYKIYKNVPLALDCLQSLKEKFNCKTVFVGKTDYNDIEVYEYMNYMDWINLLKNTKILLVSAIYDASPRIITDALGCGCAIIINKNIYGGWKYVTPETGEYFTDVESCITAYNKIIERSKDINFNPAISYGEKYGKENSALRLGSFINILKNDNLKYETYIDAILYINLRNRDDRNKYMLEQFEKTGFPKNMIHRIDAVLDKRCGHLVCTQSHIKAIEYAKKNNFNRFLILEDDMRFDVTRGEFLNILQRFYKEFSEWDVFMLSSYYKKVKDTHIDFIKKVITCSTTTGYIVNNHYSDILLEHFKESEKLLSNEVENFAKLNPDKKLYAPSYALDQYWYKIQQRDNFYIRIPYIGNSG